MYRHTTSIPRLRLLLMGVALAAALYASAALNTLAHAAAPPPGDCWGGLLSEDEIICYMLEETQRAGLLEVQVIYLAPDGGPLYIYLRQTEPLNGTTIGSLRDKAHAYVDSGKRNFPRMNRCLAWGGSRGECIEWGIGADWSTLGTQWGGRSLPDSQGYENVEMYTGGPEARRSQPGWASWKQVWPAATGQTSTGSAGAGKLDLSDVDMTNFPEPDCDKFPRATTWQSCISHQLDDSNIASAHYYARTHTRYVRYKNPPTDETALEALKKKFVPAYKEPGGADVVIVPANYNFEELWRWSLVLERFALSKANTMGITGALVGDTTREYGPPRLHDGPVWLNGYTRARTGVNEPDWSRAREIIVVWALDKSRAAAALPTLLPQLGIPMEVVGMVAHHDKTPVRGEPLDPVPVGDVVTEAAPSEVGVPAAADATPMAIEVPVFPEAAPSSDAADEAAAEVTTPVGSQTQPESPQAAPAEPAPSSDARVPLLTLLVLATVAAIAIAAVMLRRTRRPSPD